MRLGTRRRMVELIAPASIALAALVSGGCSRTEAVETTSAKNADVPTVAVAVATITDLSDGLSLTAEFRPFQEVEVMAKVSGYVKEIKVDVGDRVRQNDLIAVLEIPELADDMARAKAAVDRAHSEVSRLRDEVQRAESVHEIAHLSYTRLDQVSRQKPGLVAQQEIDDAHGKDLVAEAQVASAKSALAAAGQQVDVNKAEHSRTRTMLDYTRVTAPFAGVITKRFANTGSMIQAGTASQTQAMPLVRLSENSLLRLILPVPESAVPSVRLGQHVDVVVPTLNRSFPGRVARFSDKLQGATRTMETEVDVPNPSLVLVPGMYARVNLRLARQDGVLAVPMAAVEVDGSAGATESQASRRVAASGTVMVVNPDGSIELRKVTLGMETGNRVEVRSGLQGGDLVVIGNRGGLQAGQRVHAKVTAAGAAS